MICTATTLVRIGSYRSNGPRTMYMFVLGKLSAEERRFLNEADIDQTHHDASSKSLSDSSLFNIVWSPSPLTTTPTLTDYQYNQQTNNSIVAKLLVATKERIYAFTVEKTRFGSQNNVQACCR